MATRVNTRFVVILSVGLVIVFGAVGAASLIAYTGRDERNVAKADALMALGKFEEASKLYERSVGRDRTRQDWLEKWYEALSKSTPTVRAEYDQSYDFSRNILRQLALLRASDVEAQVRYVKELDRFVRETGATREGLDYLARETDDRARDLGANEPQLARLVRYRGLAYIDQMSLITVDETKRTQALADVRAAVELDPTDWEAALGIVRWHIAEADRGTRDGRPEIAEKEMTEARTLLNEFLAARPGHPEGLLLSFIMDQAELSRTGVSTPEAIRETGQKLLASANKVVAATVAAPAEELRPHHVQRVVVYLGKGLGAEGLGPVEEVLDRALAANPQDAALMVTKGALLTEKGDLTGAITALQKVVDLPARPVSLEGMLIPARRQTALALQVDAALRMWGEAKQRGDDAAASASLKQAKLFRTELANNIGVRGRNVLLLRDAKIAFAEARFPEAVQHLSELRRTEEGQSIEVIQLLAQALEQQSSLGEARRLYMELLEKSPNLAGAHVKLGELNSRLGDTEAARANYVSALRLDPGNDEYKRRIASIDEVLRVRSGGATSGQQQGQAAPTSGGDPIVRAILEARTKRVDGDDAGALALIEKTQVDAPDDMRLLREQITLLLRLEQRERAISILKAKADANPKDRQVQQMLLMVQADDPTEGSLAIIEQSDLSALDKAIERFEVLLRAGRSAEAEASLAEAEKINPNDVRVVDYLFVIALNKKDTARYVELSKKAAELNLDQMNGLTYQARIELVEGRDRDAVLTLERAVKMNEYLPSVRRLLAQAYMRVGRVQDALDSYQRAYEGKPDDTATARDYALALVSANQGEKALEVVSPTTGVLRFTQSDESLIRIWLDLEARYGDRQTAIRVRAERFKADPAKIDNALALNALYIDDRNWDDARSIIESLEKNQEFDRIAVAAMKANLEAKQGNVDSGITILRDYINAIPPAERKVREYMALAEFMIQNDRREMAAEVLTEALKFQDPKRQEADRRMGDLAFENAAIAANALPTYGAGQEAAREQIEAAMKQNYAAALESYKRVLAADNDEVVAKRAAETALRLENPDEAERLLAPVVKTSPEDMQILSLQAGIARQRNDSRKARELYNRSVELYPNDPNAFMQRAMFTAQDPAMLADALEDLQQAVRLRPSLVSAWVTRATMLKQNGRVPDALAVLRSAVEANPSNDELRILLIRELWNSGEQGLAQQEVLRMASERPDDLKWLEEAAGFMAQVGRFREAAELFERRFDKKPDPETAGKVMYARMQSGVMPVRSTMQKFLAEYEKLDTSNFTKQQAIPNHMLRARARAYLQQDDLARAQLDAAYELIGDDTDAARFFAEELLIAQASSAKVVEFLDAREKKGPLHPLLVVTRVKAKLNSGVAPVDLLKDATKIDDAKMDVQTRLELYRAIGQIAYLAGEPKTCVDFYKKALEISPDNVQLNNDVAYSIAVDLNDPAAGLPYAEKAVALMGDGVSSPVLDTLGWVQFLNKDRESAQKTLARAAQTARTQDQSLIAYCHLGLAQAADGDIAGARRSLEAAEKAARENAAAAEAFKDSLESLRKAVE